MDEEHCILCGDNHPLMFEIDSYELDQSICGRCLVEIVYENINIEDIYGSLEDA